MRTSKIVILICITLGVSSCSDDFLREKPLDFLSPENAFQTYEDFDASVNNLYYLVRREYFNRDDIRPFDYLFGTDVIYDGEPQTSRHSNMSAAYHPTSNIPELHWNLLFKTISEANTIISRLASSELNEEQKIEIEAKARFFRALSYRTLAYLYGGVPLTLEEITQPKTDFVRASRQEVYEQVIVDLRFAADHLGEITDVRDGEVNAVAALHLLSEVYLAAGEFENAVEAASSVINNPAMALMHSRFGSRANETPGDVYWDLFRRGNQNRSSGNTEAIWVMQFETNVLGGGSETTSFFGSFTLDRIHPPLIRDVRINGEAPFLWPIGDYTGGRGIGWGISTMYFSDVIWETDFDNDIRNANHNFVRDYVGNNPNSSYYGKVISTRNPPEGLTVPSRSFYAYQTKATTPFNHPDELYANKDIYELNSTGGGTYTDQYMFRLAETYLLRAEAYLGMGDLANATTDINAVRGRSQAADVAAGQVTIDYILDERMREFGVEEKRRLTLMRLGLLYDRVVKHNPYYSDQMEEHYNLWPIPASEIERNFSTPMEQNPGYN